MPTFLLKTEPGTYSFDDLVRDGRCVWDGVSNNAALAHLRRISKGDDILIYHTGDERAIVGIARASGAAFADPKQTGTNAAGEPKFPVVEVVPVKRLPRVITLAAVKADERFKGFALVTQSRLSVMPVEASTYALLRSMGGC